MIYPSPEVREEINRSSEATRSYIQAIQEELAWLKKENTELQARLNQNSTNSSKPSSTCPFTKPKSLREKTGRKPGGQPGHPGSNMEFTQNPDKVESHQVNHCKRCGEDLSGIKPVGFKARQQVEVEIKKVVTEHRCEVKNCPKCGHQNTAKFPTGVEHYAQYGPIFSSIMVCLNQGNFIPYQRLTKISEDIFGIHISQGTLVNMVLECGQELQRPMEYIKNQLKQSNVLHPDETGIRVAGKTIWLHSVGNDWFTYMQIHPKRGKEAPDAMGILPGYRGKLVHDCYSSYFQFLECLHGLCNAHFCRELTGVFENTKQTWAQDLKTLLLDTKKRVDAAGGALPPEDTLCENRYDELVKQGTQENPYNMAKLKDRRGRKPQTKARNLLDRLILYKEDILRWVHDREVPFSNNLAERDIRMAKVYQKIAGGFRSVLHQREDDKSQYTSPQAFTDIRSYISSASKHGIPMFEAIHAVMTRHPFFTDDSSCVLLKTPNDIKPVTTGFFSANSS